MRLRTFALLALFAAAVSARAAENPLAGLLSGENFKKLQTRSAELSPGPKPDSVVVKFTPADQTSLLVIPIPEAASDWTRYRSFTFEFTSTSTIKFLMVVVNDKDQGFNLNVAPWQNVPARAAVSTDYLFRTYMNNKAYKGHWLSTWGNHIDLSHVKMLAIRMNPNRDVTLTLGPLALSEQDVPDDFFLDEPVVDQFGQWIPEEWPGKVHSLDDLKAAWEAEDAELAKPPDFGYCPMGGYIADTAANFSSPSAAKAKLPAHKATGFFRVAEVDGKWWLIDPHGHLFFSAGMDCVRLGGPSSIDRRETLFEKLPPGSAASVNFVQANAVLRHGQAELQQAWKAKQIERLRAWGFNTVANWSDAFMHDKPGLPFVTNANIGRGARGWQGFPDVYSPAFAQQAERDAQAQCARFKDEPLLIGYFIGNEPRWQDRNLVDLILNDSTASETQSFVKKFLADKGDTTENRAILLYTLARRYHQAIVDAIHKADPNHLTLGIRYAGNAPEPILRANDVFDVFSINIYRFEPAADQLNRIYSIVKKPILIGEFHFGAAERGHGPSLVLVKDQKERGVAYQYYVEHSAAMPMVIGTHYFQYHDQPVTGRFDGENYNIGFLNEQDIPYAALVSSAQATHKRLYQVHAAKTPPTGQKAAVK